MDEDAKTAKKVIASIAWYNGITKFKDVCISVFGCVYGFAFLMYMANGMFGWFPFMTGLAMTALQITFVFSIPFAIAIIIITLISRAFYRHHSKRFPQYSENARQTVLEYLRTGAAKCNYEEKSVMTRAYKEMI